MLHPERRTAAARGNSDRPRLYHVWSLAATRQQREEGLHPEAEDGADDVDPMLRRQSGNLTVREGAGTHSAFPTPSLQSVGTDEAQQRSHNVSLESERYRPSATSERLQALIQRVRSRTS